MRYLTTIILLTLTFAVTLQGQQGQGGSTAPKISTEVLSAASTAVVKGAPFSAEAVSENVQTLADGNKISRSHTTKLFRDSEGRFRRESSSNTGSGFNYTTQNGALTSAFGFSEMISIFDPVANQRFIITPSAKTVRLSARPSPSVSSPYKMSGAAQIKTPLPHAIIPVGNGKPSAKTRALSYRPSPFVSSSIFTRPPGCQLPSVPAG